MEAWLLHPSMPFLVCLPRLLRVWNVDAFRCGETLAELDKLRKRNGAKRRWISILITRGCPSRPDAHTRGEIGRLWNRLFYPSIVRPANELVYVLCLVTGSVAQCLDHDAPVVAVLIIAPRLPHPINRDPPILALRQCRYERYGIRQDDRPAWAFGKAERCHGYSALGSFVLMTSRSCVVNMPPLVGASHKSI